MNMTAYDLLFSSPETHQNWEKQKNDFTQTRRDIDFKVIAEYFKRPFYEFPTEFLDIPCIDVRDVEYRLEITDELITASLSFKRLHDIWDGLFKLSRMYKEYNDETKTYQRHYKAINVVILFFTSLKKISDSFKDARSAGLRKFADCSEKIFNDKQNIVLYKQAQQLSAELNDMKTDLGLTINGWSKIASVSSLHGKEDISENVATLTREIFGVELDVKVKITDPSPLSYFEESVISVLEYRNPELFLALKAYEGDAGKLPEDIYEFLLVLPQLNFFICSVTFINAIKERGINICRPHFDNQGFFASGLVNASFAISNLNEPECLKRIVPNNVQLPKGDMFTLSGANQGGKTTYLKAIGLAAYMAGCGCYVFADYCKLPFYGGGIYTHFAQKEVLGKSRLIEEAERMRDILTHLTNDSLLLLNESFTGTRRVDSVEIIKYFFMKCEEVGVSVGCVTHFYEIPDIYNGNTKIISLRCGASKDSVCDYKIYVSDSDGIAYAKEIAKLHGMTYEQLNDQIRDLLL
ncbi:MAG: MutS-related protein [Eubacteriales bacterium]